MKKRKRIILWALCAILIFCLVSFLGYNSWYAHMVGPQINNKKIHEAESAMWALSLPADTKMLDVYTFCGDPERKSVWIHVWALIKSNQSFEELSEYFSNYQHDLGNEYTAIQVLDFDTFSSIYNNMFSCNLEEASSQYFVLHVWGFAATQKDYRIHSSEGWPMKSNRDSGTVLLSH